MFGFSSSLCRLGTSWPCLSCSSTFVSPAIPAALSQCPMFDFAEPIAQYCLSCV
ncbi:hypothetical protein ABL840_15790 [Variovorax sp. NFACC27]